MNRPRFSVIVASNDRVSTGRLLAGLAGQDFPRTGFEVLLVGPPDHTVAHAATGLALRMVPPARLPAMSWAAACNQGAKAARGELLLFLTGDGEPTTTLLAAHAAAHEQVPGRAIVGPCLPLLYGRADLFHAERRVQLTDRAMVPRRPGHRFSYRDLDGNNFSIGAEHFATLGGFDEQLPAHADHEFGARLLAAQGDIGYAHEALVYRHDRTGLDELLQNRRAEGRADVLIGLYHPALRPTLPLAATPPVDRRRLLLRRLAVEQPARGDKLAARLRRAAALWNDVRLRQRWREALDVVSDYWYWRGVAEESGSPRLLAALRDNPVPPATAAPELDLCAGLVRAEQRLDEERPMAVRLVYGPHLIGMIPPEPGSERLRGAHLRPYIERHLAAPMLRALAAEGALAGMHPADWQLRPAELVRIGGSSFPVLRR